MTNIESELISWKISQLDKMIMNEKVYPILRELYVLQIEYWINFCHFNKGRSKLVHINV